MSDNEKERANERLKNNDYPIGGLGMIRRHYDENLVSGNYSSRTYKSSVIKKVFQKIKKLLHN